MSVMEGVVLRLQSAPIYSVLITVSAMKTPSAFNTPTALRLVHAKLDILGTVMELKGVPMSESMPVRR